MKFAMLLVVCQFSHNVIGCVIGVLMIGLLIRGSEAQWSVIQGLPLHDIPLLDTKHNSKYSLSLSTQEDKWEQLQNAGGNTVKE